MSAHRRSHTSRLHAGLRLTRAAASMAAAICVSAWASIASRGPTHRPAKIRAVGLALLVALSLTVGAVSFAGGGYAPAADGTTTEATLAFLRGQRDACQVMLDSATTSAQRTRARNCISDVERAIAALLASPTPTVVPPSPSPSTSPTPSQPPTPSPTVTQTTPAPSPTPPPSPSPSPTPGGWPGPDNTGVPAGITLTPYTGPCTITAANTVIDAKLISCDLSIATTGVHITRSWVLGTVGASTSGSTQRLLIEDSLIDAGHRQATGLGDGWFTALRVEIIGGNRGVLCAWRCTLQDSWVHGTYVESNWHASGVRAERYSTIVHNRLACDWLVPTAQDGGCSADLTGYPDFAPTHTWLIQGNLFVANPNGAAFCSYGGSTPLKPYSNDPLTGTNIVFRDNVYERGSNRQCAAYGPVDAFNASKPGAEWTNNRYSDGVLVTP